MSEPTTPLYPPVEWQHTPAVWVIAPAKQRVWIHVLLLLATFVSTLVVGARMEYNFQHHLQVFSMNEPPSLFPYEWIWQQPSNLLLWGLPFSLTLMGILLAHEMGHYLYARYYRVYATLPYFVPFPSLIGTLGAFIRIKGRIPSRAALFDIGIAGPIAGFIPACIAMLYGLALSQPAANPQSGYIEIGFPLIFQAAARCLHLAIPLSAMSLHPIAAAAWVGMFATALNLLPGGQLDGGHIVYAIRAQLHRPVSILVILAMIIMGKLYWGGWFIWAFMLILTFRHPMVPQEPAVRGRRRWIAAFGLLMLILTFGSKPLVYNSQEPAPSMRETLTDTYHWLADTAKHYLHPRKP